MVPPQKFFKTSSSSEVDFISSLPENIREKILMYLPIKEAGRTSVLSSTWRYTWTSIPELKFRDSSYTISPAFEKMVDVILLQHSGPIYKFHLEIQARRSDALGRWIRNLSRNGIEEIKLVFRDHSIYKIHSSFFSCDNLTSVFLENCSVEIPMGFEGFKFLRILKFRYVSITDDCIKKLVSCCPMLENLELHLRNDKCAIIDIEAPNVKYLHVAGLISAFYLHAPNLLTLKEIIIGDQVNSEVSKINPQQVFGGGNLEMLEIGGLFIMTYLVNLHDNMKFGVIFHNLKNLSIPVENDEEAAAVLFLLRSSPNLEVLNIQINYNDNFWESMNGKYFLLERLRFVNVSFYNIMEDVIPFVKFVLNSAPELLELTIDEGHDTYGVMKQLLKLRRASSKAQIIIK